MTAHLEITILGCGSSGGVPRADGNFGACDPADRRNWRTRCSLLARRLDGDHAPTTIVVDASPEFRQQTAAAGVKRLDALLMTHDHADQSHGIDDIRAFALAQRQRIPCWMDEATRATLTRRFGYIFEGEGMYPAIADLLAVPELGAPWTIEGPSGALAVTAFDQDHGGVRSLGYRIETVAYSSDVVDLSEAAFEALADVDVWIVDALRYTPHPTHAHVDKALAWIERVKPRRAILTNLHIDLDYAELSARLPEGVEPAYDGMRFTVELGR
ncbi:MAG TPA: MBL fold metallo-hydrolase [Caulobacteraceae bacterium]|nr:MBL fold metallo-hydrolase [Caulobacteraceae bacterium]